MSFDGANFNRLMRAAAVVTVLVLATRGLRPLERELGRPGMRTVAKDPGLAVIRTSGALALFGGLQAMAASASWLRTNLAWERQQLAATTALIDLTVALDERPVYFWLNGARMIACDMTEWRLNGPVPAAYRADVNEEQAQRALALLETGLSRRGPDAALYIEMANLHWRRRGDLAAAARYYRLAAEQPGAPYFAARLHGELLRELGRPVEALAWLRSLLPGLPPDDAAARREVIVERIRALEHELADPAPGMSFDMRH